MKKGRRRRKGVPRYISPIQTTIDELEVRAAGDRVAFLLALEGAIENADDPSVRSLLRFELLERHRESGNSEAEQRILVEDAERDPENPLCWTALANFYWSRHSDFGKAKQAAIKAIRLAEEHDRFLINSCNSLAHIARDAEDYRTLSECLETMMACEPSPGAFDTGYERNFLNGLPVGAIDTSLRARYGVFLRKSGHLRDYRPHEAIARFIPVFLLVQERGKGSLTPDLVQRAEAARYLLRDMRGVPANVADCEDIEGAIRTLGQVVSGQLVLINEIVKAVEDDRLAFGLDEAERLAFEKFRSVKGRYFRRHGCDELNRYIASMRAGEFDDW